MKLKENIAGAEVLVYKNNEIAWHKALGLRNLNTQEPLQKKQHLLHSIHD